jgi:hypothetical protein
VIQYAKSIQDCVHNTGSRFLEQRFIVDSSAPTVEVTSPGVDCDLSDDVTPTTFPTPDGDYTFVAEISDGSGIDPETVEIEISGPECGDDEDSDEVNIEDVDISEDQISFVIPDEELCVGQYRITISGSDNLGNDFTKTCILTVGGTINAVSDIKAYPNPFDPKDSDVTLSFNTEHEANVKVAIYDWNGDQVRTIDAGSLTPGQQSITWGGDAEDGTPLANGVYLVRIEANDGSRTVTEVLKVAIWRE